MPVWKYRSVEDLPPPPRYEGPDLAERIDELWTRAFTLFPARVPRGVQRFRTIEEANAARDQWTLAGMRSST